MSTIIKMNYPEMEKLAQTYKNAAAELEDMSGQVKTIASMLADGGLLGKAGDQLEAGLSGPLTAGIAKLCTQMQEQEKSIREAMQDMKSADSDSARFHS